MILTPLSHIPKRLSNMSLVDQLIGFITSGSIGGIPTLIVMAIPFIIGLIAGFLIKKILKIAIIAIILAAIASYIGLFTLSLDSLKSLAEEYGPTVFHYGTLLVGILPLSLGFIVGLILGFLLT